MRTILLLAFGLSIASAQPRRFEPITVERKLALVIGNAGYTKGALTNPGNDADAMTETLSSLGFSVTKRRDLNKQQFKTVIDAFAASLRPGDLALFYYSGHGLQANRENYLLPVDFAATRESDVEYEAYSASRVQHALEGTGARLRILILDACRDNPYKFTRGTGGLAPMESNAEGTLIAFATGENNTADDNRAEKNGLYTKHLLAALRTPGLAHYELFRQVKEEVYSESGRRQNPAIYDNVVGRFYFSSGSSRPEPPPPARVALRSLSTQVNPKDGLTYKWIPPGTFAMGCSPDDNGCAAEEKPAHQVTLTRGFWIGRTEVTQEAYQRVTGTNPSKFKGSRLPVDSLNWNDSRAYCQMIGMRLPTEAEWEYAARGGNSSGRYGPADAVAWHDLNSGGTTHEVGQKLANGWGLYDMLGNVYEWVEDRYQPYTDRSATDPKGAVSGESRIMRGSSWFINPAHARASLRLKYEPGARNDNFGFRCAGDSL